MTTLVGAPSVKTNMIWQSINWNIVLGLVNRLQMRIAKAIR